MLPGSSQAGEPPQSLKKFQKVPLAPKGTSRVVFTLTHRDLSIWDAHAHAWAVQSGTFSIRVGASSRDIRLEGTLAVPGPLGPRP